MSNQLFTVIFTVEIIIKTTSLGFVLGKEAYLKNSWNVLDFFLIALSIIEEFINRFLSKEIGSLSMFRIFRIIRALRPLRAIKSAPELQLIINSLISSFGSIGRTVIICISFIFFSAVLGVQVLFNLTFVLNRQFTIKTLLFKVAQR